MKSSTPTLPGLMSWLQLTRAKAPLLENEADALLARLQALQQQQQQIDNLIKSPLTLGLYGHSLSGKNHLLSAITGSVSGRIEVQLGEKTLDYLTHINPGHSPGALAVRFTRHAAPIVEHYPLLITLYRERDMARQFIRQHHASSDARITRASVVADRLRELAPRRQAHLIAGISGPEVMEIARGYQHLIRRTLHLDDALWFQMAELAPWLAAPDRAALLAVLWGDDDTLTERWLRLSETLHHLGNASQVLAPASLVVDTFLLPTEGFLIPAAPGETEAPDDVMICPLDDGHPGALLSISQQDLLQVSAELVFTLGQAPSLDNVEVLDIPTSQLEYYTERFQPDTLLVCNAAAERREVTAVGKALARWTDSTQCPENSSLPGLIWAITPFDTRFTSGTSLDDGVQRLIGQPGTRWGTLQALDSRNMHRLLEWLTDALTVSRRNQRVQALQSRLNARVSGLFHPFIRPNQPDEAAVRRQAETLVRTLQSHAARHGELIGHLMPSREALQQRWHQYHSQRQPAAFTLDIDLFASEESDEQYAPREVSFASEVHFLWVNHLRQLAQRPETALLLGLNSVQMQMLCDVLIVTSYRMALPARLEDALQQGESSMALDVTRTASALGDFVAWLGYDGADITSRPASRVNKGSAIFVPQAQACAAVRLTRLDDRPDLKTLGYVYDWLVALYTRATENIGYRHPLDINDECRAELALLLADC